MPRMKAHSIPLILAVFASLLATASAQLIMNLSTNASYRQNSKNVKFLAGGLNIALRDGSATFDGCSNSFYLPPGTPGCDAGTSGFVIFGRPDIQSESPGPYYAITSITPALYIEPRQPELCLLNSAPASTLPRPLGGFRDGSYGLYFNLNTSDIRQYIITEYTSTRQYTEDQRSKFVSDIVPGAYFYSFPRLGFPNLPIAIPAQVYPMPEGLAVVNNQDQGFRFDKFAKWNAQGFVELSYLLPNTVSWQGLTTSGVISSDKLSLSIRVLSDPVKPNSAVDYVDNTTGGLQSIFPPLQNNGDPRVLLTSPYVTSFTLAPVFAGGTRGVLELELNRSLQTSVIASDRSVRIYQVPVVVVNRYTDYQGLIFENGGSKTGLLDDTDGDGYNNLNEWILDSNADQKAIIPIAPVPSLVTPADFFELPYFGFSINQKLGTVPAVVYTLQRSVNGGRTWQTFSTDADWRVSTTRLRAGEFPSREIDPAKITIKVSARRGLVQPPGTLGHLYRVKITTR
jgi:hypothetical protein